MTFKFAAIFGSAVIFTLACGSVQAASSDSALIGTWRLISMTRLDDGGVPRPVWGDQPLGLLIYTPDGHVAAQVYDARRPKLGVPWESAAAEAARIAFVGLATYFGTYAVDAQAQTVTHTVQGAMTPDWIGAKLVRSYRFVAPSRIELRIVEDTQVSAIGLVLTWERVP